MRIEDALRRAQEAAAPDVGRGILTVVPDRGVACVWSPALGPSGSSAAGLAALDPFTTYSDWTVF